MTKGLQHTFTKNLQGLKCRFTLMCSTSKGKVFKKEWSSGHSYEAFKTRFAKAQEFSNENGVLAVKTLSGVYVEVYPSNSEFGIRAIDTFSFEKALRYIS